MIELVTCIVVAVASFTIGRVVERAREHTSLMSVADEQRLRRQYAPAAHCVWDAVAVKANNP